MEHYEMNVLNHEVKPQVEDTTFIRPAGHRGQAVRLEARCNFNPNGFEITVPVGPALANSHVYYPAHLKDGFMSTKIGSRLIVWIKTEYSSRRITIHCTGGRVVSIYHPPNEEMFEELVDSIQQDDRFSKVSDDIFEQFMSKKKYETIVEAFDMMNRNLPWHFISLDHIEGATFGNPDNEFRFKEKVIQEVAANLVKDFQEILRIMSGHLTTLQIVHHVNMEESIMVNFRLNMRIQEYKVKPDGALERNLIWANVQAPRQDGGFFSSFVQELFPCCAKPLTIEDFEERIEPKKVLRISAPRFPRKL